MDAIVKLSAVGIDHEPIMEGDIPPEVLTDLFKELSTEYDDRKHDSETRLCDIIERDNFLFGALEPEKLIERARGWNKEIKQEFLRCVDTICKVSANGKLPEADELEMDTPAVYRMKQAAMELDNAWFDFTSHAVYMENSFGIPFFRVALDERELTHIISHPEEYAIVTVVPRN